MKFKDTNGSAKKRIERGQFLEQIGEDGLVSLTKTIVNRAEVRISLESELRKLRGVEEETDMILPWNLELEKVVDED